ncbi:MAG: hypothetical protein QM496_11885 [Verrucomicrobiota bacterium]
MNRKLKFFVTLILFITTPYLKSEEKLVDFKIPITQQLAKELQKRCGKLQLPLREVVMGVGIIFHQGSSIQIDRENSVISGRLAHSEAMLVLALSAHFASSSEKEIKSYFDDIDESHCFDPKKTTTEKVEQKSVPNP